MISFIIIGDVHQFIDHCLIPLDPGFIYTLDPMGATASYSKKLQIPLSCAKISHDYSRFFFSLSKIFVLIRAMQKKV